MADEGSVETVLCIVKYNEKTSVTYVRRGTTFDAFIASIASLFQLQEDIITVSYLLPEQEQEGCFVKIIIEEDIERMLDVWKLYNSLTLELKVEVNTQDLRDTTNVIDMRHTGGSEGAGEGSSRQLSGPVRMCTNFQDIGQEFSSVEHLRMELSSHAIIAGFNFRYIRNDRSRVTVKCKADGCLWHVHAIQMGSLSMFRVKDLYPIHSCGGGIGSKTHPRATRKWISSNIKETLRTRPLYRPSDIKKDFLRDHGVNIDYSQAWNGREMARSEMHGSNAHSYDLLRWYCLKVKETNPGSFAEIHTVNGRFNKLFISFNGCLEGFKEGCRPMLFLDGTHLKDHYRGTLLAATAKNGNNGIFPVAICVCDIENAENWAWFLEWLRTALYDSDGGYDKVLTVISDREKGLIDSVKRVFPNAHHAYCLRHLKANFLNQLKNKGLTATDRNTYATLLSDAAYKLTTHGYFIKCGEIREASEVAYNLMLANEPEHWANSLFLGQRYGNMYSNVAESFNAWILEARHLPICRLVDTIRFKLMEQIASRRSEALSKWNATLCPRIEDQVNELILEGRKYYVGHSDGVRFEVCDSPTAEVNLCNRTCSCRSWEVYGIPCKHACCVINTLGHSVYSYVEEYFLKSTFLKSYSHPIFPIPNEDQPIILDEEVEIRAPVTKKQRGRPKTRRIPSGLPDKRPIKCSRCNEFGHNRATCNSSIAD